MNTPKQPKNIKVLVDEAMENVSAQDIKDWSAKAGVEVTPTIDSVVEWEEEFRRDFGSLLDKPVCCPMKNNDCGCDGKTYTDDVTAWIEDLLSQQQSHHEATMRELVREILGQGGYVGDYSVHADTYVNVEDIKAIASRRGIPLVDKE